jgi:ribosomal protein L11 methyltransferase
VIRLAVRVPRERAELVLAELLELVPAGVEEVELEQGTIEYAVYGAPGELPALPALRAVAGGTAVEVSTRELDDDWSERWKRFHRPVLIVPTRHAPPDRQAPDRRAPPEGEGDPVPALYVRPPWEAPRRAFEGAPGGVQDIVIDPGQAFGTGAHASTRLCLELMLELAAREPARGPLLDVGTGSGVLAITAARLGFAPVVGIDHERESILAARHNAAANGVAIELHRLDLRSTPLQLAGAGDRTRPLVVVANLLRPLLLELARALPRPPRHLIAGGLLAEEIEEVTEVFATRLALRELRRRRREEWVAVWLSAP